MFRQIKEFPLYEIDENLTIRHITSQRIKKPHRNGPNVRLYGDDQKEYSRKIVKLFETTFPELVEGVKLDDYPDYRVRSNGDIYALYQCKVLKPATTRDGYLQVSVTHKDGTKKSQLVHRLVAYAFLEQPEDTDDRISVNHIDGNKKNNSVDNLEFITHKKNMEHAVATGLYETKVRKCKVSLDGTNWEYFKSFEDARKYISSMSNTNPNHSQIRRAAVLNDEKDTKNGVSTSINPFRCAGYIVKY